MTRINHFVCTHYHEDHYGGIDELADDPEITIESVYGRGEKHLLSLGKRNKPRFKDYERTVGNGSDRLTRGETYHLIQT